MKIPSLCLIRSHLYHETSPPTCDFFDFLDPLILKTDKRECPVSESGSYAEDHRFAEKQTIGQTSSLVPFSFRYFAVVTIISKSTPRPAPPNASLSPPLFLVFARPVLLRHEAVVDFDGGQTSLLFRDDDF